MRQPRTSALLNVALSGSVLISPSSVLIGICPCIGYCRALASRRTAWFSEEFLHVQPKMASMFVARMTAGPHQWTVVTDRETSAKRAQNNKRAKTMYLGFVSQNHVHDKDLQSAKLLSLDMAFVPSWPSSTAAQPARACVQSAWCKLNLNGGGSPSGGMCARGIICGAEWRQALSWSTQTHGHHTLNNTLNSKHIAHA